MKVKFGFELLVPWVRLGTSGAKVESISVDGY